MFMGDIIMFDINEKNYKIPGFVIDEDGKIILMPDNNHDVFLRDILRNKLNINLSNDEDNRAYLIELIIKFSNLIVYIGCTYGDRKYDQGHFYLKDISNYSINQLNTLLKIYNKLSLYYPVDIFNIGKNDTKTGKFLDEEISIGDIYEYLINNEKSR